MKRLFFISLLTICLSIAAPHASAQCSICTRTAQQMGEGPAKGLNAGILYLAFAPMAIGAVLGYRWWRNNREAS